MSAPGCRRGYSLLEMLIVIATAAIILAAATSLLGVTLRTTREASDLIARQRGLAQFERQFRRDAWNAATAEIAKPALLFRRVDRSTVRFEQTGQGIERQELNPDGQVISRELYRLEIPLEAHWEVSTAAPITASVRFAAGSEPVPSGQSLRALRIAAAVGLAQRDASASQAEEKP